MIVKKEGKEILLSSVLITVFSFEIITIVP